MDATLELDIKQKLAQLSEVDRRSIASYLLRLRHETEESIQETTQLMNEMDAGKKTKLSSLKAIIHDAE